MITSVMQKLAIDMGYYYDPGIYDRNAPYAGTALAGAGLGAVAGGLGSRIAADANYRKARKSAIPEIENLKRQQSADVRLALREFDKTNDSVAFGNNLRNANNAYASEVKKVIAPVRDAYKARFKILPKLRWAGKGALLGTAGAGAVMLADNLINKDPWNS